MIEVKNLNKNFGLKKAVDNVSFKLEKGQVLGFMGPNGAGKSTTMRMITGFITPTSGSIFIDGIDISENSYLAKQKIGYLPENAPLYNEMNVYDFLDFTAEIRGFKGKEKCKRIDKVIDLCFLKPVRKQLIDTISKGYKHRTCLAQALIHDPKILILDEPTDGLDPNQKFEVRNLIKNMGKEKAIIFSTHILEEIQASCSRAMVIDRGKIVKEGTPQAFKEMVEVKIILRLKSISKEEQNNIISDIKKIKDVDSATLNNSESKIDSFVIECKPLKSNDVMAQIAEIIHKRKDFLISLHREHGRLDEFFRKITSTDDQK